MKSIIFDENRCYLTGTVKNLDVHHFIQGTSSRKLCDKYGLFAKINHSVHMSLHHKNEYRHLLKELEKEAQRIAMEHYGWTIEDWIKIWGYNYLYEEKENESEESGTAGI